MAKLAKFITGGASAISEFPSFLIGVLIVAVLAGVTGPLAYVLVLALASPASAWDAGPSSCKHDECTGGVNKSSIPDTQPRYAASRIPSDNCAAGSELYGGVCYHVCSEGWHRTAVCTCQKNGGGIFDLSTDCGRFGASGLPSKSCPAGMEFYGGLCYDSCPAGTTRSAVSTCVHEVNWRANTHLWVVNRGIELLAKSPDPMAKSAASRMSQPSCRTEWEAGLWDADDGSLAETGGARGSHFYNGAGRDFEGNPVKTITYLIAGVEQAGHGNARTNANAHLAKIGNLTTGDECHELGLALHYLTDMTQPMHASSFSAADIPTNLHPVFEDYVGNIQGRFPTSNMTWGKRWQGQAADSVLDAASKRSNSLAPGLYEVLKYNGTICTMTSEPGVTYTGYCFIQLPNVDVKIGEILTDSYQSAASYIYAALKGL